MLALSFTISCPVLVPVCVGVKVTLIVHFFFAARLVPHVVADTAKSPVVEIAMLLSVTDWLLVKVNVFGLLVVPTFCFAKVALAGVNVACAMPVPDSATDCGLSGALSVNVRAPLRVPACVGVKVTFTVQFAFGASVAPQVLLWMAKSPLVAMLVMLSVETPVLVRVTVCGLLVTPTTVFENVRDFGERLTIGPLGVTVSLIVV